MVMFTLGAIGFFFCDGMVNEGQSMSSKAASMAVDMLSQVYHSLPMNIEPLASRVGYFKTFIYWGQLFKGWITLSSG